LAVAAGGIGINFRITPLASPMRPRANALKMLYKQ
jgi:hypothetical protein